MLNTVRRGAGVRIRKVKFETSRGALPPANFTANFTDSDGMGLGMFGVDLEGMTSDLPPSLPPALRLGGALWLVVGQTGPLSLSDSALLQQMRWLGAEVHTVRDAEFAVQPATRRWPGVHAAVISASVREGFLRGSPLAGGVGPSLPLVVLDGPAWLSLQLAGRHERVFGGSVQLVSDGHALAAGLRRGFVPLYEKPGSMAAAVACGDAQVVARAASATGLASLASLFGHEVGSALCGRRAVAPARRVALGIGAAGFAGMGRATPQASRLLAAAVLWAAGAAEPAGALGALQAHAAAVAGSEATLAEFEAYATARQLMAREVVARKRPAGAAARHRSAEAAAALSPSGRACGRLWPTGRACAAAADAARVAVLVHTCDAYAPFWGGWSRNFGSEWNASLCWPVYFAPERLEPAAHVPLVGCGLVSPLRTGEGEFSTRLLTALRALPTPHVLYMQAGSMYSHGKHSKCIAIVGIARVVHAGG